MSPEAVVGASASFGLHLDPVPAKVAKCEECDAAQDEQVAELGAHHGRTGGQTRPSEEN